MQLAPDWLGQFDEALVIRRLHKFTHHHRFKPKHHQIKKKIFEFPLKMFSIQLQSRYLILSVC